MEKTTKKESKKPIKNMEKNEQKCLKKKWKNQLFTLQENVCSKVDALKYNNKNNSQKEEDSNVET